MTGKRIAVAATFSAHLLTDALAWWLERLRPGTELHTTPYGQVLDALFDPGSVLRAGADLTVLVVRVEDLLRDPDTAELRLDERAGNAAAELLSGLPRAAGNADCLVCLPPITPGVTRFPEVHHWVREQRARLAALAGRTTGMHLLDADGAAELYGVDDVHDDYGDRLAHVPYTADYLTALATVIARGAESLWRPARKMIVLDCDNTLWRGVCGEVGPDGVELGEPYLALQRFMRAQREHGRLLCLCSRNNEADVWAVFDGRSAMVLRRDEITAHRIGWGGKPAAIAALADELGLATGSVVFVDDDAVECAMVSEQLPEVTVVQVPADPAEIPDFLAHQWVFDHLVVTGDDRARADRYAAEQRRAAVRDTLTDHEEFLRRCAIEVSIVPPADADLERAAQLTQRTTQFTAAAAPVTASELRAQLADGAGCWVVRVSDRFGDYGTVGLMLTRPDADVLVVEQFLMSCRVLNRHVERTMLEFLTGQAVERGATSLRFRVRVTDRNAPARLFLGEPTAGVVEVPVPAVEPLR